QAEIPDVEQPLGPRGSLAGERAAEQLKQVITNRTVSNHLGPLGLQAEAQAGASYTDNLFYSGIHAQDDFILSPSLNLGASVLVGNFNRLNLALGVGYEWFANNHQLN